MTHGHVMELKSQTGKHSSKWTPVLRKSQLTTLHLHQRGAQLTSAQQGGETIVTCEGDNSQTTTGTNHVWGSPQTVWDCRAASGSEAHRTHTAETSVGEQTQVSQEKTSPICSLPTNMGTSQVAGEQQHNKGTCHKYMTIPDFEHNHLSATATAWATADALWRSARPTQRHLRE